MKKEKYFNIYKPTVIAGKTYIPAVGYPLTERLERTIEHLASLGQAEIFDHLPVFENGKIKVEKVKKAAPKKTTGAKK